MRLHHVVCSAIIVGAAHAHATQAHDHDANNDKRTALEEKGGLTVLVDKVKVLRHYHGCMRNIMAHALMADRRDCLERYPQRLQAHLMDSAMAAALVSVCYVRPRSTAATRQAQRSLGAAPPQAPLRTT